MTIHTHVPRALALTVAATVAAWPLAMAGASQAALPPTVESVITAAIALGGGAACLGIALITALGTIESLVLRRPSRVHAALPSGLRRLVTGTVVATVLAGVALPASAQEVYPGWAPPSPSPTLTSPTPAPSPSPVVEVTATGVPAVPAELPESPHSAPRSAPPAEPAAPARAPIVELHAESSAPALPSPTSDPTTSREVHVVSRGESLWRIAANLLGPNASNAAIAHAWPLIYQANRDVIGEDPGLILPGQRLTIPQEVAA